MFLPACFFSSLPFHVPEQIVQVLACLSSLHSAQIQHLTLPYFTTRKCFRSSMVALCLQLHGFCPQTWNCWGIVRWVNCSLHKHLSLIPHYLCNNPNILIHNSNLSTWRDRQEDSGEVCWPASRANWWAPWFVRDPVSKNNIESNKDPTLGFTHTCIYMWMHTYTHMCTCNPTSGKKEKEMGLFSDR